MTTLSDDEIEEWAEEWGVTIDEAEDLIDAIRAQGNEPVELMTPDERSEYFASLREALEADGWDLSESDLWDLYFGYSPGGGGD